MSGPGEKLVRNRRRDPDALTLARLWPRPNFREAVLMDGVKPSIAILYMVVYDNLRRRPIELKGAVPVSDGYWPRMYQAGIRFVRDAWETRRYHTLERLAKAFRLSQESLAATDAERQYATATLAKGRLTPGASPLDLPEFLRMRLASLVGLGWPADFDVPDDAKVGVIHVSESNPKHGLENGYYPALAIPGTGRVVPLRHEPYATRAAATRNAIGDLQEQTRRAKNRGGTPVLEYKRTGVDWRNGHVVNEEALITGFQFKSLEFGNWVTAAERQSFMDGLFDACMDLCDVLSVTMATASCYGRLGIAFGSQGRGAATGAAHFDPTVWLMHLTKSRGGGALCHEFGHALDAMLADALFDPRRLPDGEMYLSDLMAMYHDPTGSRSMSSALIPMVRKRQYAHCLEVFDGLFESLFSRRLNDSFFNRSEQMDVRGGGMYWSTPRELFARAFETYTLDRMGAMGLSNEFLVRHVDEYIRDRDSHNDSIFPQGYQRRELATLFDSFRDQLRYVKLDPEPEA